MLSGSQGPDLWPHGAGLVTLLRVMGLVWARGAASCPHVCLQMVSSIFHQRSFVSVCLSGSPDAGVGVSILSRVEGSAACRGNERLAAHLPNFQTTGREHRGLEGFI